MLASNCLCTVNFVCAILIISFNAINCKTLSISPPCLLTWHIYMQQVPEEIERVMVGIQAYLSIRRHASDSGLSFFEDDDETKNGLCEKVF
jgi:hypothetical protein